MNLEAVALVCSVPELDSSDLGLECFEAPAVQGRGWQLVQPAGAVLEDNVGQLLVAVVAVKCVVEQLLDQLRS